MSHTTYFGRAIQALLQVQMGTYSSGQLLVKSTGATGTVTRGDVAIPIVDDQLAEDQLLFVQPNPATTDGSWEVTSSGTAVDVQSVQGGAHVNVAVGTECRWDPALTGIEATSEVTGADLAGGAASTAPGTLRCVRLYKDLGTRPEAQDFFKAKVSHYPAAVLTWVASTPADGASGPSMGPTTRRVGATRQIYQHEWVLWLITSRMGSSEQRKREGDELRDDLLELLTDREAYRGLVLSTCGGIEILDARLQQAGATSYIDVIRFASSFVLEKRDERTFNDWLKTRMRFQTDDQPPYPEIDVVDQTLDHSS